MGSSSSSEEETFTIVVSPVELTMVTASESKLKEELEAVAKKFDMPLHTLVISGFVRVFRGEPLGLVVQEADVRTRL